MLASLLRETFRREEDLVARVGGDEFVVLLTGIDALAVQSLADQAFRGASAGVWVLVFRDGLRGLMVS
jgi:GGDEF domain-containing protein